MSLQMKKSTVLLGLCMSFALTYAPQVMATGRVLATNVVQQQAKKVTGNISLVTSEILKAH